MASAVLALRTRVAALLSPKTATALAVRCASKKTGGSPKNLGGKSRGQHYGIKKMEGHCVHAGNILGTQHQFRWHPGAHVGLGKNKCLYALEEGIVRYTKDVYVPNLKNSRGCGSGHQPTQGCCALPDFCPRGSCQT
ncbi:39S ribosomal protein L27, mitochondrial [Sigmodon hispidus]